MTIAASATVPQVNADDVVVRKVFRRLIGFLFLLFVVSFLDRINVGFAGLSMNRDLGLSATMFGLSVSAFYAGYLMCEIPSNLMLARYGAKRWISRIMISFGIMSAATMLATGPYSLYLIRLLVGVAEAGFLPGILVYLTLWFPRSYRARASSVFLVAMPVTIAFGSTISGLILDMDRFLGLAGWQWLFLLEGLPAVILGFVAYLYLDDGPAKAPWLSETEKALLEARLEQERASEQRGALPRSVMSELFSRDVVLLSLAYFGLVVSLNANTIWTPQIVRAFASGMSFSEIGVIAAIPAVITALFMPLLGFSSDKREERLWHIAFPLLLAGLGWLLIVVFDAPLVQLAGLIAISSGSYGALAIFWTIPASAAILSPRARPAGIALINSVGNSGAAIGPFVVGFFRDLTGGFAAGLSFVAMMLIVSAILTALVVVRASAASAKAW